MELLNDKKLASRVNTEAPMVYGFPPDVQRALSEDPFGRDSPIQPTSVDLHVGGVFLPGETELDCRKEFDLDPGKSIIVTTHESFNMPDDVAALAFPLAGRGQKGLLMLNPGHIDPGYKGNVWFSFINLSRETHRLSQGDRISTVLFWSCEPVESNFTNRHGYVVHSNPPDDVVRSIAGDALMLEQRAAEVVEEVVQPILDKHDKAMEDQKSSVKLWGALLGGVLPVVATAVVGILIQTFGRTSRLETELINLKSEFKVLSADVKLEEKIEKYDALEERMNAIETGSQPATSLP